MRRYCVALVCLTVVACAHSNQSATPPATTSAADSTVQNANQQATLASDNVGMACTGDSQCQASDICVASHCVAVSSSQQECGTKRVQFPFNSATLEQAHKDTLERVARCLRAVQGMQLTIEGNADERGTEEYNLALGEQRARNVAKYLTTLGVSGNALKTVSYGKDKPMCNEHDEECWAKNRRASLKPKVSEN